MKNKYLTTLLGFVALAMAGSALANKHGELTAENPIGDSYYYDQFGDPIIHAPRIDFTNVVLNYSQGSTRGKAKKAGTFTATNANNESGGSTFSFFMPGSEFDGVSFESTFSLTAKLDRTTAEVLSGSFSFLSSDSMFGFGETEVCNKRGKGCKIKAVEGEVFAGTISDFGWSEANAFLEFEITSFTGWACDMGWCTTTERLYFNVDGGTLGLTGDFNKVTSWDGVADGAAVIPVPAAVWLFGSGLLGLVGVARRKKA